MVSWTYKVAEELRQEKSSTTFAAGVSPSGPVHAGNLRDLLTSYFVKEAYQDKGGKSRLIFSWDDFDRFRKIPNEAPSAFKEHIGKPLVDVPDPLGVKESYADRFESEFEESVRELGVDVNFLYQSQKYRSGEYTEEIIFAMENREEIGEIIFRNKTQDISQEEKTRFQPISIYSEFTGKDHTQIVEHNGNKITYECLETEKKSQIDLRDFHDLKLKWKVDWPMRWMKEDVGFEPGGHDHAVPGGSYDVASQISEEVFQNKSPKFLEYKFVKIQGDKKKMSGSIGNVLTPSDLLEIYEPGIIKWMFGKKHPSSPIQISTDYEVVRKYEEFDDFMTSKHNQEKERQSLANLINYNYRNPIPFRKVSGYANSTGFKPEKVKQLSRMNGEDYDEESIEIRTKKSENWMKKHEQNRLTSLLDEPNKSYVEKLDDSEMEEIRTLKEAVSKYGDDPEELDSIIYEIPKKASLTDEENSERLKNFFQNSYNLILGQKGGPRLSTLLWGRDRERIEKLLNVEDLQT